MHRLFIDRPKCQAKSCTNLADFAHRNEAFCEQHKHSLSIQKLKDSSFFVDLAAPNADKTVETYISPSHYRQGKIEPWDFIVSQNLNFLAGNVVKYISRYKHKNGVEDLKKAKTYLEKLISIEKAK
jgi:hypothetical protein